MHILVLTLMSSLAWSSTQWTLGVDHETPSLSFTLADRKTESSTLANDPSRVTYEANTGSKVRVRAGYGPFRVSYAFAVAPEADTVASKGRTRHEDLRMGYNFENLSFDFSLRSYRGFYVSEGSEPVTIRPDLTSHFYGVGAYYAFSPDSYQFAVLNSLDWLSNSSGSSGIAMLRLDHFDFQGEQSILSRNGFKSVDQNALTVGGGYAGFYSGESYLLGADLIVSLGPELHKTSYQPAGQSERNPGGLGYSFGFGVDLKGAYRWGGFQLGAELKTNLISTYIGDTGIQANGVDGDFFAVWKF